MSTNAFSSPDDFVRLLPSIRRHARNAFYTLDPEAREEAIAEVVANSFAAYRSLLDRGRAHVIGAAALARFAISQVRAGHRVGSPLNADDVSSVYCQHRRGIGLESLETVHRAADAWESILIEDHHVTPADIAAIRIDFETWLNMLPPRQRQIAEVLSVGETTQAVAKLFDLTAGRISQLRNELRAAWESFQGKTSEALLASA